MVNSNNRNRKYILTLEKFKSNILSKLYKSTLHHSGLKKFLNRILENGGIQLSELTDEYFKYLPINKIKKDSWDRLSYMDEIITKSDVVFGFDLTNTIKYYNYGIDVKIDELRESSDYVIIFDIEKAKENLSNVKDKRKEREKGKEGSHHFMSKDDILNMNRKRLISKLASKYKVSGESLRDIKKYTDFEKILKKVFEKNPVLVLSDRNITSDIKNMVKILLELPKLIALPYEQKGVFESALRNLNETYERIIKNPLILYKLNIFEGEEFRNNFIDKFTRPVEQPDWELVKKIKEDPNSYYDELLKVDKELDKLRNNIKSYINNFEYENLNDVLAIFVKMNSYREAAERLNFFLHNSAIETHHGPDTSKDQLEYQYILSISRNIPYRMKSFDKYIEDIKTLSKLW